VSQDLQRGGRDFDASARFSSEFVVAKRIGLEQCREFLTNPTKEASAGARAEERGRVVYERAQEIINDPCEHFWGAKGLEARSD